VVIYFAVHMRIGAADVHAWLPEGRPVRQRYEEFVRAFGSDQYLVVSWDGCQVDDPRLPAMADSLRQVDDRRIDRKSISWIESLQTTEQMVRRLTDPPIALSKEAALARLESSVIGSDGTSALFISFAPAGIESHKDAIELIRRAADDVPGLGRLHLKMVGSVYEAYAVDVAAEESLKRLVLPSSLLGVALAWLWGSCSRWPLLRRSDLNSVQS
jgi:hypothetical protein